MITHLVRQDVEFMPQPKLPGILYVSQRFELAIHLCACGCGGEAVTPLDTGWKVTDDPGGPSINHSIGHQHWPCRSHYHVKNGKIELCADHGVGKKK